jgi:hypothetical protein
VQNRPLSLESLEVDTFSTSDLNSEAAATDPNHSQMSNCDTLPCCC